MKKSYHYYHCLVTHQLSYSPYVQCLCAVDSTLNIDAGQKMVEDFLKENFTFKLKSVDVKPITNKEAKGKYRSWLIYYI